MMERVSVYKEALRMELSGMIHRKPIGAQTTNNPKMVAACRTVHPKATVRSIKIQNSAF